MKIWKKIIVITVIVLLGILYSYGTWPKEIYNTDIDSNAYENVGELLKNSIIKQSFICNFNGLYSLKIKMSNLGYESKGSYEWKVIEKEKNIIVGEGRLQAEDVDNSNPYKFSFKQLNNSENKEYEFILKEETLKTEHGITVMTTEKNKYANALNVNNEEKVNAIVLTQQIKRFNSETFIVFLGMMMYLLFFIWFLLKLFK